MTPRSGHGVEEWYWQRFSAVALLLMLPLMLWLLMAAYHGNIDQTTLQHWLQQPLIRFGHSFLAIAVLMHAYIGLKIILEDYIHRAALRTLLLAGLQLLTGLATLDWLSLIWL